MNEIIVSKTCSIIISDYTPPGLKAVDPNAVVKWGQLRAETGSAISMCTTTDQNVITGAVIIVGRAFASPTLECERFQRNDILTENLAWVEVKVVLNAASPKRRRIVR